MLLQPHALELLCLTIVLSSALAAILYLPWRMRRAHRQTFLALARAVEAREPHMLGHAEQTARHVVLMARCSLVMGPMKMKDLEYAALLHGIGKVSVPYGLLNTPACLTAPADRFVLRDYVRVGAVILDAIPHLRRASEFVRYHHEYIDGSGYPYGRYGRGIPLGAQMICVASEYFAMTSPRLYRAGLSMTPAQAEHYLRTQAGRRYSPYAVSLFLLARRYETLYQRIRAQARQWLSGSRTAVRARRAF